MIGAHCISRLLAALALAVVARAQDAPAGGVPEPPPRAAGWRLADAASPYLREHADNPVEWWPWGEAAFARAKELDRPVFLSIGYSACHWCHRMERDTFEDADVARRLTEGFVCIKVDREERPDVDARYLHALVLMTGSGGWPASLFLTPDGQPFFGGTYYPPESGPAGTGFRDLLDRIRELWTTQRETVHDATQELRDVLLRDPLPAAAGAPDLRVLLEESATALTGTLDDEYGGQAGAPKFPPTLLLQRLLRERLRTGLPIDPLLSLSLDAMSSAGLCDHVGGGFFRYCVDARWETPHFEKMLYDNAQLATLFAEAGVALGEPRFSDVARDTLRWVRRELRLGSGLFAGSLDADSLPFIEAPVMLQDASGVRATGREVIIRPRTGATPEEARFYLWTPAQLERLLGDRDGPLFARLYNVTADGTFLTDGEPTGLSLPRPMRTVPALAAAPGIELASGDEFLRWRSLMLAQLLADRDHRPRPARDEKALAAWNGLLLTAFARGAMLLDDAALREETGSLARALRGSLLRRDEGLPRVEHQEFGGRASGRGDLLDTAAVARGLLDAHEATGDPARLLDAVALARGLLQRFQDEDGGFWETEGHDPLLPDRGRNPWDGPVPAGSSVAIELLLRLAPLDDSGEFDAAARRALARLAPLAAPSPGGFPALLGAADAALGPLAEIVLDGQGEPLAALQRAARGRVLPAALLLPDARALVAAIAAERTAAQAAGRAPLFAEEPSLLADRRAPEGEARAWVCVRRACLLPAATPDELAAQLAEVARRPAPAGSGSPR